MKRIIGLKLLVVKYFYSKIFKISLFIREFIKYRKIQIPFFEYYKLYFKIKKINKSKIFGKSILIIDPFWYLFSLKEIFLDEIYLFKTDEKSPIIIDCGSNIGLSIIYFKRKFPNAIIYAFEPDERIFISLKYNLNQFQFSDVNIYQKAVWINDKPVLFESNGSLGGHIISNNGNNILRIETIRLSDFLNQKIDFLKIDIEGAEFEVIKDSCLFLNNVRNIFIEYHSFSCEPQMIGELLTILKESGFRVYIKEAFENMKKPFIDKAGYYYDLQLNIFGYRIN